MRPSLFALFLVVVFSSSPRAAEVPVSTVGYIVDHGLKLERNQAGEDYWDIYVEEMLGTLGVSGKRLSLADLESRKSLAPLRTLILGSCAGETLSDTAKNNLRLWVAEGGMLIGFQTIGLDDLFGIRSSDSMVKQTDRYAIPGDFDVRPHRITYDVHPATHVETRIPVVSDVHIVSPAGAIELGAFVANGEKEPKGSAVTWATCQKGCAGYFAFDPAQTCWLIHQGRPAPSSPTGGKAVDMQILGNRTRKLPYTTQIAMLLQNMIAQRPAEQGPCPFIYACPPRGQTVPDAVLYWSGDEYSGPVELSLKASDFMRSLGLPYHINLISHRHPMTREQFDHITKKNRHEISCYYDLDKGRTITAKHIQFQSDKLFERFGIRPICTLNGPTRWRGGTLAAEWMQAAGGKGDNTFFGLGLGETHPTHNGPKWGFGFGSGTPYFFYKDHTGKNERLDFIEMPMFCYETGHLGSIAGHQQVLRADGLAIESTAVHAPLDMAIRYNLVVNMFYHPVYVANYPHCREALREIVRYIGYRKANVLHMGANAACLWWHARRASTIATVAADDTHVEYDCRCANPDGMIVRLFIPRGAPHSVTCDGKAAVRKLRGGFAGDWLFVVVPEGKHRVKVIY